MFIKSQYNCCPLQITLSVLLILIVTLSDTQLFYIYSIEINCSCSIKETSIQLLSHLVLKGQQTTDHKWFLIKLCYFLFRRHLFLASLAVYEASSLMAACSALHPTVLGSHPVMRVHLSQGHTSLMREDMYFWVKNYVFSFSLWLTLSHISCWNLFLIYKNEASWTLQSHIYILDLF